MAITLVGHTEIASGSPTLPAGWAVGDACFIFLYNSAAASSPPSQAGWYQVLGGAGSSQGYEVQFKILTATDGTLPTWTNANACSVVVLRGTDPVGLYGDKQVVGVTTKVITTPALTLQKTDGSAWVLAWGGSVGNISTLTLSSTANLSSSITKLNVAYQPGATSWAARAYSAQSSAANCVGCAVEVKALVTTPVAIRPVAAAAAAVTNLVRAATKIQPVSSQLSAGSALLTVQTQISIQPIQAKASAGVALSTVTAPALLTSI